MTINTNAMRGVRVETRSGQPVGRVASFDLDAATGRLVTLRVKVNGLIPGLLDNELSVAWDAIIEMSPTIVIVADHLATVTATTLAQRRSAVAPSSGMMKEG